MLYDYPKQAHFGRVIPKNKIYEHGSVNTSTKDKFVNQIEKIVWSYKLAPETLNLEATQRVPEIQVFDIYLKGSDIGEELLNVIDKVIPFPIIYQIHKGNKCKMKAAYKRPSEADKNKWVVGEYFESDWIHEDDSKTSLPIALNLSKVYEQVLQSMMPTSVGNTTEKKSLQQQVDHIQAIQAKEREYTKLKAKRNKEKQFNRKADLNVELKKLRKEIEMIKNKNKKCNTYGKR